MKQHLRQELKNVFDAPQPLHKRAFLRTLEQPKISIPAFILTQFGYIRRWVWIVSALVFVLSAAGAAGLSQDTVWVASALMPLLALTVVSESGRSQNYEMAELEMATRFSLRSVVLARLGILGMENLIVLVLLLPVETARQGGTVVQAGVYVLVPYLMTTFSGLWIVRRIHGREAVYICAGTAVCISFLTMALQGSIARYCQAGSGMWGIAAVLLLLTGTMRQCAGIVNKTAAV